MWILIFIGIDGAEGEVLSGRLTLGQHVEEGRFPHVRYSNYTNFQIGPDTANKRFPFRFLDFLWRHPRKNRNLYRHHFPLPPSLLPSPIRSVPRETSIHLFDIINAWLSTNGRKEKNDISIFAYTRRACTWT